MNTESAGFRYPRLLTIAGSDSGGGAGIQADLKTFSALGCFGMSAITAITAQNTTGVRSIHPIPIPILVDQIDAVVEDIGVDAVKIGMLHAPEVVAAVADAIDRHRLDKVVLDPVMIATSGAVLIDAAAIEVLVRDLFPRAIVVTPNLDEAAHLVGRKLVDERDIDDAATRLLEMGARAVLIKGGHLPGPQVPDLLASASGERIWLRDERIETGNTHGTGCTLSSAIAAYLACGQGLSDAVRAARHYVRGALEAGAHARTGQGSGPLNHGYAPVAMLRLPL